MLSLYSGMQKFWLKSLLMRGVKQVEDEMIFTSCKVKYETLFSLY